MAYLHRLLIFGKRLVFIDKGINGFNAILSRWLLNFANLAASFERIWLSQKKNLIAGACAHHTFQ